MTYATMSEVKAANRAAGQYFFTPDTLRFFRSKIGRTIYGGRFFVTSEQPPYGERRWSVREALSTGAIKTVGEFQEYATEAEARAAAKQFAAS